MYVVTAMKKVHALDARTGRRIWMYRDEEAKRSDVNRGTAILSDIGGGGQRRPPGGAQCTLPVGTWHKAYAGDQRQGQFATLAPMALKDRVIVGVSGGDSGVQSS